MRERGFGPPLDDKLITFIEDVAWSLRVDANELVIELMTRSLEAQLLEAAMLERCRVDEDPEDRPFLGYYGCEAGQARLLLFELNMVKRRLAGGMRREQEV